MAPKKVRASKKNKSTNVRASKKKSAGATSVLAGDAGEIDAASSADASRATDATREAAGSSKVTAKARAAASASAGADLGIVDLALLATLPLPAKNGAVLVIGGSSEMPGALLLAGQSVLRAGASKLQLATIRAVAQDVALHLPEARVYGLDATRGGAIDSTSARALGDRFKGAAALLIGPGMIDGREVERFVGRLVSRVDPKKGPMLVLDAEAMLVLQKFPDLLRRLGGRAVVLPDVNQLATMLGIAREEVKRDPIGAARQAAREWRAVVALRGAETLVVAPDGRYARNIPSHAGFVDALAGVVATLLARGAGPFEAATWAVHAHAKAGEAAATKIGPRGFFARELVDEIPRVLAALETAAATPPALSKASAVYLKDLPS